jgi:tRNA threonylcarbamoyl adenosine modification protein YeaZ
VVDLDAGILAEESSLDPRAHAEVIGELIRAALVGSGVDRRALSGVVAGMGPGPFTGLRVGIAAARAFAFGISRPVVPVVSHDAIAFGRAHPTLVVTDARRREVAWSRYGLPDELGLPVRIAGPTLAHPDELASAVPDLSDLERVDATAVSAGALGMLAERMWAAGRTFPSAEALYLRAPDVTLSAPKRVTG